MKIPKASDQGLARLQTTDDIEAADVLGSSVAVLRSVGTLETCSALHTAISTRNAIKSPCVAVSVRHRCRLLHLCDKNSCCVPRSAFFSSPAEVAFIE